MPKINVDYELYYYSENLLNGISKVENRKKEVFFDIIASSGSSSGDTSDGILPPPPSLPKLEGMEERMMKEMKSRRKTLSQIYDELVTPFSQPLAFLWGIPPYGVKKFSLQLYANPAGEYLPASWKVARKRKKGRKYIYEDIYGMDEYIKLWGHFSKYPCSLSDTAFLMYLFVAREFGEEEKGTKIFGPSKYQLCKTAFPKLMDIPNISIEFPMYFKREKFPSFFINSKLHDNIYHITLFEINE